MKIMKNSNRSFLALLLVVPCIGVAQDTHVVRLIQAGTNNWIYVPHTLMNLSQTYRDTVYRCKTLQRPVPHEWIIHQSIPHFLKIIPLLKLQLALREKHLPSEKIVDELANHTPNTMSEIIPLIRIAEELRFNKILRALAYQFIAINRQVPKTFLIDNVQMLRFGMYFIRELSSAYRRVYGQPIDLYTVPQTFDPGKGLLHKLQTKQLRQKSLSQ